MPTGSAYITPDDWTNTSPLASARFQKIAEDLEFLYRRIQKGTESVSFGGALFVNKTITFPVAFSAPPVIQATAECSTLDLNAFIISRSATGCVIQVATWDHNVSSVTGTLHWLAIKA